MPRCRAAVRRSDFAGVTVAEVLADPARFEGETLADPLEGVGYGGCKAKVMLRADGTPWIHSFAHGRTVYELKLDAAAVRAAMERRTRRRSSKLFVELAAAGRARRGRAGEAGQLRRRADRHRPPRHRRQFKEARKQGAPRQAQETRARRLADGKDPRPHASRSPASTAPWLPVIGQSTKCSQSARHPSRRARHQRRRLALPQASRCRARMLRPSQRGQRHDKVPPPEQWVIIRMNEIEVAEKIEKYIEYRR